MRAPDASQRTGIDRRLVGSKSSDEKRLEYSSQYRTYPFCEMRICKSDPGDRRCRIERYLEFSAQWGLDHASGSFQQERRADVIGMADE